MDVVQSETLHSLQDDNGFHDLDILPNAQQLSVVKTLAKLKAYLSELVQLGAIESITMGATNGDHPLITHSHELWHSCLAYEILHAVQEWCSIEEDQLSTSLSDPECTPQAFAGLFQMLSSLIPPFIILGAYSHLVLHHSDLALRNIFDKDSLSSH
jgi:hypothetical protein